MTANGRSYWVGILVMLAGCATSEEVPQEPTPTLVARVPSGDPYAVPFVRDPPGTRKIERADRVPEWSDAQTVRALDQFLVWADGKVHRDRPSDLLRFGLTGIALRGTARQNSVLRHFLSDRAKHANQQIYLESSFLDLDPLRQPTLDRFQQLPSGALWGVIPAAQVEGVDWRVTQSPSLSTLDSLASVIRVGEFAPDPDPQRTTTVGILIGSADAQPSRAFAGFALDVTAALIDDAKVALVLEAVESTWAPEAKRRGLERLPAARRQSSFRGRFVVRQGEVLLVVKNTPAGLKGLEIRWERISPTATAR